MNITDFYIIIKIHKVKLFLITLASMIIGFVASSPTFIKPLYKSYAIVYPVNLSPSSEESNTEQLLQWFNSEEVKNAIAKKYNLYDYYRIDSLSDKKQYYFDLRFKELISISPTMYESIEISVKDETPAMAKKLVQAIIDETNNLITSVKKERLTEYIKNNQIEYVKLQKSTDSMQQIINKFRVDNDLINIKYQSNALTKKKYKGTAFTSIENVTWEAIKTKEVLLNTEHGKLNNELNNFNYFKNELEKYNFEINSHVSFTNVVSKPTLPSNKCYPLRSFIVMAFALTTFLISCIIIILLNTKKQNIE